METRFRQARWLAVLTMIWLIVVWILSMVYYTRGLDFIVIFLAGLAQLSVLIAWAIFRRALPGWLIAGHGLILLALAMGLSVVPGPSGTVVPPGAPSLPVPWLVVGLVPAGAAMIVAAILRRPPSSSLAH